MNTRPCTGRRAGPGAGWRSLAGATSLRPREHGEPVSTESSLHGLDAATVHEAYGRRGALPSEIKPVDAGFTVCAPAFTVDCPAGDNLWIHHAVYAAQPHDVLVVHTRGEREAGYWGEILSRAAIARELSGLVIDGGVRDVERLVEIGLPVFAANVCIGGTAKDPAPAVASARRPSSGGRWCGPATSSSGIVTGSW